MSIARRFRFSIGRDFRQILPILAMILGILIPSHGNSATTERVVVNPQTGLAISGFDPVTYFTNSEAKFGRPDLEFAHLGGIWRFQNVGNRAAFAAHPDVYMPRFGGYDPVGVAQGKPVPGDPLYWAIMKNRLYLFYSAETRARFLADADDIAEEATRRWPDVRQALSP